MIRKTTSFIMLYSFIIMVVSGFVLFISPFGRLAMMIQWSFLGLDKMQWQALHLIFMLIFTIAGMMHIFYNYKAIMNYLKSRSKKIVVFTTANLIALSITGALFVATASHIEPFESFVKMNKSFNDYWTTEFRKERMQQMMQRHQPAQ